MRTVRKSTKVNEANKYAAMFASLGSYQEIETKYKDLQSTVADGEKSELDSAYQEAVATTVGEAAEPEENDKPDFLKGDDAKKFTESLLEAADEAPFGGDEDKKAGFYKDEDKTVVFDNTANEMIMEEVADDEEAKDWLSKRGVSGDRKPDGESDGEAATMEELHESYKGKPLPTLENYMAKARKIKG